MEFKKEKEDLKDITFTDEVQTKEYTSFMQAVDEYEDTCTTIAMEECAELIQAISKAKRGKLDRDNLAEEIADVLISIEWISEAYDINSIDVIDWKRKKKERVVARLNSGEFD